MKWNLPMTNQNWHRFYMVVESAAWSSVSSIQSQGSVLSCLQQVTEATWKPPNVARMALGDSWHFLFCKWCRATLLECSQLDKKLKLPLVALPPHHLKKSWGGGGGYGTLLRERQLGQGQRRNWMSPTTLTWELVIKNGRGGGILLQYYFTDFIFNERSYSRFFFFPKQKP